MKKFQALKDGRPAPAPLDIRADERVGLSMDRANQLLRATCELASARDWVTLSHMVTRHSPLFAGDRPTWLPMKRGDHWRLVAGSSPPGGQREESLLAAAPDLFRFSMTGERHRTPWVLFPSSTDGVQGLLVVHAGATTLTEDDEWRLEAFAAVLRVAVENVQLFSDLTHDSITDALTRCFNRKYAFLTLDAELRRAKRSEHPLTVLMLDVNGFKGINDQHGHLCGDMLLTAIGDLLHRTLRTGDIKCRYGGDEFLVILPETSRQSAQHVIDQLAKELERLNLTVDNVAIVASLSVGAAQAIPGELDASAIVARADAQLYAAKHKSMIV
jgi:diguanylate cyclase (GGDEF)-like protein